MKRGNGCAAPTPSHLTFPPSHSLTPTPTATLTATPTLTPSPPLTFPPQRHRCRCLGRPRLIVRAAAGLPVRVIARPRVARAQTSAQAAAEAGEDARPAGRHGRVGQGEKDWGRSGGTDNTRWSFSFFIIQMQTSSPHLPSPQHLSHPEHEPHLLCLLQLLSDMRLTRAVMEEYGIWGEILHNVCFGKAYKEAREVARRFLTERMGEEEAVKARIGGARGGGEGRGGKGGRKTEREKETGEVVVVGVVFVWCWC